MANERSSAIKIGNKEYELLLTTRATREIGEKFGGLDKVGTKLSEAKDASAQIIAEATQEAHRRRDDIIVHAQTDADAIRNKARADIELERKKALNGVKDDISRIALDIAEKVVEREMDSSDHDRMVEDFLRHMGDEV